MRDIYTSQFEIMPLSKPAESIALDAFESTLVWIRDWYESKCGTRLEIGANSQLKPQYAHTLSTSTEFSNRASIRRVNWSYPHKDNLHWTVTVQCSRFDESIDFSLRLMIESTQFFIAPLDFDFGRPRIVPTLLRKFECYYGGARLGSEASMKVASDVPFLVKNRLLSHERRLPIVIISPQSMTGLPLVDSNEIASAVAGIAEVYVLADRWASYALTSEIGKHLSCYNGAIRIYWPLGKRTFEAFCPVVMPNIVSERGTKLIAKSLLRDFSSISSFRYISGPIAEDAEEDLREWREEEAAALRRAAKESGDFEALARSYSEELQVTKADFVKLKIREKSLLDEIESLRLRSETDQANLRAMYSVAPASLADESHHESESETCSVYEAVQQAESQFRNILIFTRNAQKTAQETPYKQPERAKEAFEAMALVCDAWKNSKIERSSMGSFEEAFDKLGFEYKGRVSSTSAGKWSEEYEMVYKNKKVSIQPHLAIGKGGPETCLRIYFYIDDEANQFVIDHVGRHKTNLTT